MRSKLDSYKTSILSPLLAVTVAAGVTFVTVVIFSFAKWSQDNDRLVGWGTDQAYVQLAQEPFRTQTVEAEIAKALILTAFEIVLALPFAWLITRRCSARGRSIVLGLLTIPYFVNPLVRAFAWRLILQRNGLIYEAWSHWLGMAVPLRSLAFGQSGVDLAIFSGSFAFAVLPVAIALQRVPASTWLASESLGAKAFTEFRRIALRFMAVPAMFSAVCVFAVILGSSAEIAYLGGANEQSLVTSIKDAFDQNPPEAFALGTLAALRVVGILFRTLVLCAIGRGMYWVYVSFQEGLEARRQRRISHGVRT